MLKELKKENSGQEKQIEKEPGTFQKTGKRKKKKKELKRPLSRNASQGLLCSDYE